MASYTPTKFSTHQTLTAATVDTVTFPFDTSYVEVLNRDATNPIYFTADGTTPSVALDGTDVVGAGDSLRIPAPVDATPNATVVKLISAGAAAYSIRCS